jgi:hypothetical protein
MVGTLLSHKPLRLLIIFTLAFIVFLPLIRPLGQVTAQGSDQSQYYTSEFAWDYGGNHWIWNLSIPQELYDAYKAVPDSVRIQLGLDRFGFFTTTHDNYMQTLAQKLNNTAAERGYSSYDEVNFVLAFVQSIPYKFDNVSTGYQDYPRFPVETLVDDVGDCKSHSILFSTLMLILGYGTVFINPPDHLAVGILGNDLTGASWTYNNQTYYYCETTGIGFKIGDLPDQFQGISAFVYPIEDSQQYVPNLQVSSSTGTNPTISQPTIQPVLPLSVNLIFNNPVFFIIVVAAVGTSITVTIKTAKSKKTIGTNQTISSETSTPQGTSDNSGSNKFCIYCGSNNKSFASYCEKCGKKIA